MITTAIDSVALGKQLCLLRKEHGFSQTALANALGVTRPAVSSWERGTSRPSLEHLMQLSKLYQMDLAALIGEDTGQDAGEQDTSSKDTTEAEHSEPKRRPARIYILWSACLLIIGAVICVTLLILRRQPQKTDEEDTTPISEMDSEEFDITSADGYAELEWW